MIAQNNQTPGTCMANGMTDFIMNELGPPIIPSSADRMIKLILKCVARWLEWL